MEWPSYIVTAGAAGLGWLLSEASQLLRSRRQFSEATGLALGDVLLVWHDIRAVVLYLGDADHQCALAQLNSSHVREAAALLEERLRQTGLSARLANTSISIAPFDPLLAAEIRLRARSVESIAQDLFTDRPSRDFEGFLQEIRVFFFLMANMNARLETLAYVLAWRHSIFTWFRTRIVIFQRKLYSAQTEEALALIDQRGTRRTSPTESSKPGNTGP